MILQGGNQYPMKIMNTSTYLLFAVCTLKGVSAGSVLDEDMHVEHEVEEFELFVLVCSAAVRK